LHSDLCERMIHLHCRRRRGQFWHKAMLCEQLTATTEVGQCRQCQRSVYSQLCSGWWCVICAGDFQVRLVNSILSKQRRRRRWLGNWISEWTTTRAKSTLCHARPHVTSAVVQLALTRNWICADVALWRSLATWWRCELSTSCDEYKVLFQWFSQFSQRYSSLSTTNNSRLFTL